MKGWKVVINIDQEEAWELGLGEHTDNYIFVAKQFVESTRWQDSYLIVVKDRKNDKLYGAHYYFGATEYQDDNDAPTEFFPVTQVLEPSYRIVP